MITTKSDLFNSSDPTTSSTGLSNHHQTSSNSNNTSSTNNSNNNNSDQKPTRWQPYSIDAFSANIIQPPLLNGSNFASEVTNQPSSYANSSCVNSDTSSSSSSSTNNSEPSPFSPLDFLLINTNFISSSPTFPLLISPFDQIDQPLIIQGNKVGKKITFTVGPNGLIPDNTELSEVHHVNIPYDDLELVGKYIGSGSFGHVIVAKHKVNGKKYALKMIYQDSNHLELSQKMEWAEFAAIYFCDHLSLIKVHECYYRSLCFYMLLDYCNCGSLRDILKTVQVENVTERILSLIVEKVLIGLDHLQQNHIIHRDIKPENILVNYDKTKKRAEIKIGDFGLCGHKKLETGSTFFKTVNGTLIYRSPERLLEENYNYTSDIWSLGVMAVELIVGSHPLEHMVDITSDSSNNSREKLIQIPQIILNVVNNHKFGKNSEKVLSDEFKSFVKECCEFEQTKRPFAREMLSHAWIKKFKDRDNDVIFSEWLALFYLKKKKNQSSAESPRNQLNAFTSFSHHK